MSVFGSETGEIYFDRIFVECAYTASTRKVLLKRCLIQQRCKQDEEIAWAVACMRGMRISSFALVQTPEPSIGCGEKMEPLIRNILGRGLQKHPHSIYNAITLFLLLLNGLGRYIA